ncbi:hypothetical protein DEO72_LG9g1411 [Vigna unguiculata]|uniref:Uncharacterized protein n=1 Tax=Vigna unguiculata TaxID=3917 RepID=A0A4D6N1R7_VIGUN|nr:hypothetical protein DEO72_LG9g1411 [Vigna unguiculata]
MEVPSILHGFLSFEDGLITLTMELVEAFLELWIGIEDKHIAISGCGLMILENRCEYACCDMYEGASLD